MRSVISSSCGVHEVNREHRKTQTIAELLQRHEGIDKPDTRSGRGHVHKEQVGQMHGDHHGPNAAIETKPRYQPASENSPTHKADDAYCSVNEADLLGCE